MIATDVLSAAASWRPQLFGDKRAQAIPDPIVEPLWTGPRILVLVDGSTVRLTAADGEPIDGFPEIVDALREAAGGATALLEAFLTPEPIQTASAIAGRESLTMPKPAEAMTQMIVGTRGDRKDRLAMQKEEARRRTIDGADERLAVVAVDLLWLDDESLFDVPLLERKRILESVLPESDLVRVGNPRQAADRRLARLVALVRLPPTRVQGRQQPLHPRSENQDWATAAIPPR